MRPDIAEWLVRVSVQLFILACMVWILSRCCRRAPAAARHILWLLVLIKAFMPPVLPMPHGLALWLQAHPMIAASQNHTAIPQATTVLASKDISPTVVHAEKPLAKHASPTIIATCEKTLFPVWLIGLFLMCVFLMARSLRQSRMLRHLDEADAETVELLGQCAVQIGVRRLPQVKVCAEVPAPMLVGILHPVVLLPYGISQTCAKTDLSAMLLHELAHLKRKDMIWVWLYQIAHMVFFFHPAIWLAGRELERERELACDELVLSSSTVSRKEYASGYLSAVKLASGLHHAPTALAMAEPFDIEAHRLRTILYSAIPRFSYRWSLSLLLIALIGLPTFSGVAAKVGAADIDRSLSSRARVVVSRELAMEKAQQYLTGMGVKSVTPVSARLGMAQPRYIQSVAPKPKERQAWIVTTKSRRQRPEVWIDAENGTVLGGDHLKLSDVQ